MNPRHMHRAAVALYLALIALLLLWLTLLAPPDRALIAPSIAVLVGPLLLPLRGLLHGRRRAIAGSTLLIGLYFAHGVAAAASGGLLVWLGAVEIVLSLGYFLLAILFIRGTREAAA